MAVLSVAVALVVTLLLHPDALVAPVFFLAIILSAWFGGTGPGLLAALLATLILDYFFLPPLHRLDFAPANLPHVFVFFLSTVLVSSWSAARKRAETLLRQARDEQEAKVQERTADLKQANEKLQAEIAERERAEEALDHAQAELAHLTRMLTMGELTASIAHEVNQPLTAVITNANACLRWLAGQPPNLDEAREAVSRIVRDGNRASEVIKRIRALMMKTVPQKSPLDINDAIREVIALAQSEARRKAASLTADLTDGLPPVLADRVQLQQVVLNLIINGIEAMSSVTGRSRQLLVRTQSDGSSGVMVAVQDSGTGIAAQNLARLFDAFYTTKADGMGMGLSISRSIIEAHGGKLWAEASSGHGATFRFTLPADGSHHQTTA
ncbi:MAG TPA: ATP-binding protein [Blastocatellia bacterium]|nr:ATP-binding protein [Blastocatellia bacterium]